MTKMKTRTTIAATAGRSHDLEEPDATLVVN
jgi:hypothetical protein